MGRDVYVELKNLCGYEEETEEPAIYQGETVEQ